MKRIVIPAINNTLSPHFGHANYFSVFDIENDKIVNFFSALPPPHEDGSFPNYLAELGTTDLIVGGIGPKAIDILNAKGINVYSGAHALPVIEIVEKFLSGTLELTANTCDHETGAPHDHQHHRHH